MFEEDELGCLGCGESAKDFILTESDIDGLPELYEKDDIIFEYNQGAQERSKKSCTIFNAIGAVSDLTNYEFSLEEIKEIDDLSYKNGRIKGQGRYVQNACDLVRKWWNSNEKLVKKYGKIAFYRVNMSDDDSIAKILAKKYTICTGFRGSTEYKNDRNDNAVVDGTKFGTTTYQHAVNDIRSDTINIFSRIKDSYKGRKNSKGVYTNIYGILHKFSEMTNFFTYGYVFTLVKEDNIEEIKRLNKVKSKILATTDATSELRHATNSKEYQNKLHEENEWKKNEWLEYINTKLKELE